MSRLAPALLGLAALAGTSCAKQQRGTEPVNPPFQPVVVATLSDATGEELGEVAFADAWKGVYVSTTLRGLEAWSVHGLHVHEGTSCEAPDFTSAGGHFSPDGDPHGAPSVPEHAHAGDLGNIVANGQGISVGLDHAPELEIDDSEDGVVGHAVILHMHRDDLQTQPSGDAGDRMACGIARVEPRAVTSTLVVGAGR